MAWRTVVLVCAFVLYSHRAESCTSIMIGPEATNDGSVWVGQSDDGEGGGDTRLVKIPAQDWPAGTMRPVIDYGNFPRYVGKERGFEAYYPSKDLPNATNNVIGHIPQVRHTFGYIEADYAISNDQGLAFGESTTSARTFALSKAQGGPSLLSMYELSRLAAERCNTSRCAVQLMGDMGVKYGFYGDPDGATGGESILVADAEEQFIFHILTENETTGGAIWAAARVPRHHATIVSNAFVIGDVNATDSDNFLFSDNMHRVAKAMGWWDGEEPLHWTRTFSAGEYTSKYYAGRRMWGFWDKIAPSLQVPPEYSSYVEAVGTTYPVSAAPDSPVVQQDVLWSVYRNYYQGTPYDLSKGPAAGPFGTPIRIKPGPAEADLNNCTDKCSHWERPIASFRSTSIHQTNIRPSLGLPHRSVVWFLPGAALSGVFMPVYTSASSVGHTLSRGLNVRLDRSTGFWAFKEMAQFVYPKWNLVKDILHKTAAALEARADAMIKDLDTSKPDPTALDAATQRMQREFLEAWQGLYAELLMRFSDTWDYTPPSSAAEPVGTAEAMGYPKWWLKEVEYTSGTEACYPTCR